MPTFRNFEMSAFAFSIVSDYSSGIITISAKLPALSSCFMKAATVSGVWALTTSL